MLYFALSLYPDLPMFLAVHKPLSVGVVPYMYLQCVYVFCDAFNGSNKAVQTAVICGVGSPVAQASARATVERTLLRLQELPSAKGLAGKWDISSLEQFAEPFGGLGS